MEEPARSQRYFHELWPITFDDWDQHLAPLWMPPARTKPYCPELELFRAILRQAAEDLGSPNPITRLEACHWFRFPDLPAAVSLRSCCDALNLDPHRISRTALRWAGLA